MYICQNNIIIICSFKKKNIIEIYSSFFFYFFRIVKFYNENAMQGGIFLDKNQNDRHVRLITFS